jgi:hypothetical protein
MNKNDLSSVQRELDFTNISSQQKNSNNNNFSNAPYQTISGKIQPPMSNSIPNKFTNAQLYSYQKSSPKNSNMYYENRNVSSQNRQSFSNLSYKQHAISDNKHSNNNQEQDLKINLDNILLGKDKRTIMMIRNVPNKYTLSNLVDEINTHFLGKYDYINLPVDPERKLNLGYAFINFVDPLHIVLFYDIHHNKKWNRYRSDKVYFININLI